MDSISFLCCHSWFSSVPVFFKKNLCLILFILMIIYFCNLKGIFPGATSIFFFWLLLLSFQRVWMAAFWVPVSYCALDFIGWAGDIGLHFSVVSYHFLFSAVLYYCVFCVDVYRFLLVDSCTHSIDSLGNSCILGMSSRCRWPLVFMSIQRIYIPNVLGMKICYLLGSAPSPLVLHYDDNDFIQSQCCHVGEKNWV